MIKLPASSCLISAIIDALQEHQQKNRDPAKLTSPPAVVLPTRRLGTALVAALTYRSVNRGIVAPIVLTLDDLILNGIRHAESSDAAQILKLKSWPAERCEMLIETILRQEEYSLLHPGHAHEIAHFFGELEKNCLESNAFAELQRIVSEDIYRGEETVGMLGQRFAELTALYGKYRALLQTAGATSKQLWQQRAAKFLATHWHFENGDTLPWQQLIIAGFTSASPAELELFQTLKSGSITFVLHESPPIFAKTSPLKELTAQLDGPLTKTQATASTTASGTTQSVQDTLSRRRMVVPITSVADEAAYAVQLATDAVKHGIPASCISIVVTAEETYGNILRTLLSSSEVGNYNFAVPVALADTSAGVWLQLFTKILSDERQRGDAETVLDFIAHPLSRIQILENQKPTSNPEVDNDNKDNKDDFRDQARALMTQILCDQRIITTSDLLRFCENRKSEAVAVQILSLFEKIKPFGDLYRTRTKATPSKWRDSFTLLAAEFIKPDESSEEMPADSAAKTMHESVLAALESFSQSLAAIESALPESIMSGDEFIQAVDRYLLSSKVRSVGDPLAGIQVLGLTEARHMPFVLTIIVGCVEGKFPRSVPKDSLVDQYLQSRIGLPGWRQLESMEDTTFGLLNERLPAIVLTYPQSEGDSPSVRSRFLDRLVNEGQAHVVTPDNAIKFIQGFSESVQPSNADYVQGRIGHDSAAMPQATGQAISASSLTQLLTCPYAYAMQKMGVRDQAFHRDDDRRAEGEWMHEVLEAFFTGHTTLGTGQRASSGTASKRIAPDLPDSITVDAFDAWAFDRLKSITELLAPPSILKTALWLRLLSLSFPRFIEHVKKIWTRGTEIHPQRGWKELRLRTSSALSDSYDHSSKSNAKSQPRIFALIRPPAGSGAETAGAEVGSSTADVIPASGAVDSVDFCESIVLITDYKRSGTPTGVEVDRGFAPQIPFYVHALQQASEPKSIADVVPLEKLVAGFWSILDGEFILAGTGSPAAFDEAKRLGFVKSTAKAPRDLGTSIDAFRRNWKWRLDEITATASYTPDESSCGFCQLSTSCRRADPHLKAPFKDNRRLDRYRAEQGKQKP